DIEHLPVEGRESLVRRCFSGAEREWLAALEPSARAAALARGWVRKEAVTKAWGVGVAAELRSVEVLAGTWRPGAASGLVTADDGSGWEVSD
ncbi:4'-phosphopantetheinyl transferase superfamily protein, partial [Streptomyces sp. SM14]|uniref:4'-phosphopantetheinyl transferase family protein n=1 Tax=Streptomyces sp. SM14 TaxID=1736045 RepID=UPI0011B03AD9